MAIASVIREATNTDLVFIVGVLSGLIVPGLWHESLNAGACERLCHLAQSAENGGRHARISTDFVLQKRSGGFAKDALVVAFVGGDDLVGAVVFLFHQMAREERADAW